MWVVVKNPEGEVREVDVHPELYIEIGDILDDGSVVIDLPYPDDIDEDMLAMDLYENDLVDD